MDFFIKLKLGEFKNISFKEGFEQNFENNIIYFNVPFKNYFLSKNLLILGVKYDTKQLPFNFYNDPIILRNNISTPHCYIFYIDNKKIYILNGYFNLLPIYIYQYADDLFISSKISLLKNSATHLLNINKKYILQQNLFNYGFSNETIYNEIKLLNSNSYISFNGKISIHKSDPVEKSFVAKPKLLNESLNDLINLFIEINNKIINNNYFISFTSGFDGRTLVALAKSLNKEFITYSFGTDENEDLTLPREQAALLGIDFLPIRLDNDEYLNKFWELGCDIITESGAATNFLQVHWPYSASLLSKKANNLVSGLFGSELFRAAHVTGQFTSPALVEYFKNIESDSWIDKIKNSDSLKFLNLNNFKHELEELIDELNDYRKLVLHLNPNQRFYKYIFDEVFRKFFVIQLIKPQLKYVNIITPYFNLDFVNELLKTEFAGVNNDFFTHNPVKRFKGQLFYAELIKRTWPELLYLKTGKGYKPIDLLTFWGKFNLALNYTKKRFERKIIVPNLNNLAIISAYEKNIDKFTTIPIADEYYSKIYINYISSNNSWKSNEILRNKLFESFSVNVYLNK